MWHLHYTEGDLRQTTSTLYACQLEVPPRDVEDGEMTVPGVTKLGKILVDFEGVNLDDFESALNQDSVKVWRLRVEAIIKLGARQGTLTIRSMISGRECGEASIDFSQH